MRLKRLHLCCLVAVLLVALSGINAIAQNSNDLSQLSLEDLLNIQVTSVSKKAEKASDSSAAVYVITQEDIRRSGVKTIPDALRMVPGVQVASVNSHIWAISCRGFNDRFANKMLVLIDGRSVYTPLFSGTWWDAQDTLLEDVERIEVIRGPGATMWGANAVNGVINIITSRSDVATGTLVTAEVETDNKVSGAVRHAGNLGDDGHYRIYAKTANHGDFRTRDGGDTNDSWVQNRQGFRIDKNISDTEAITIHGDTYTGSGNQILRINTLTPPYEPAVLTDYAFSGSNLLARWEKRADEGSESSLQIYYDRTRRDDAQHFELRNTLDLDFQTRNYISDRKELMWGLGYRRTSDRTGNTIYATFDPERLSDHLIDAFVQEDISIPKRKLKLTLGSKVEHNSYTGFELEPSIRMVWAPDEDHSVWASISRAVRTPTRGETHSDFTLRILPPGSLTLPPGTPAWPIAIKFNSNEKQESEKLMAYELGYRFRPSDKMSVDIAGFYNEYDDIRTLQIGNPYPVFTPVPHIVVPMQWRNMAHAHTHGVELTTNYQACKFWRLSLGFSWMKMATTIDPASNDPYITGNVRATPNEQINLSSYLDLSSRASFDTMLYYVDSVPAHSVPAYIRLDVRLSYRPSDGTEISLVGQNLLDDLHPEFGGTLGEISQAVPRTVYLKYLRRF